MSSFRVLFSIVVEHSYFFDRIVRGVEFSLSPNSMSMIGSVGIVVKKNVNGIDVLCEEERLEALRLHAKDDSGLVNFSFMARVNDKEFFNYTDSELFSGDQMLCFRNSDMKSALLTKGEVVSAGDLCDPSVLVQEGGLSANDLRRLPHFVISLDIPVRAGEEWQARDFRICFGARRAFWKYYLLGKMNRSSARIVDVDNRVEFKSCGEFMLQGNRQSQVFISTARIPISEKSPYRFQLRDTDRQGDRILVRRLPVASVERLGSEVVDGKREVVFENFVNF
jgi:hypothetical protein